MQIPSYAERLKKIKNMRTLLEQQREAQHTVLRVKTWITSKLPMELRMVPNASRMLPHLHRKLNQAQEVERFLQRDFYKLKARFDSNASTRNHTAGDE